MCNAKEIRDFDSLYELIDYFDSEQKCVDHLEKLFSERTKETHI